MTAGRKAIILEGVMRARTTLEEHRGRRSRLFFCLLADDVRIVCYCLMAGVPAHTVPTYQLSVSAENGHGKTL